MVRRYYRVNTNPNHEGNYDDMYRCHDNDQMETLWGLLYSDRYTRFPRGNHGVPVNIDELCKLPHNEMAERIVKQMEERKGK